MKARFLALAALVLGLASCQKDFDAANPVGGGEVDFQLSVGAAELATRASEDQVNDGVSGLNSAYGAIDYLQAEDNGDATLRVDWNDVNLRYTLEVYDKAASYADDVKPVKDRQVKIVDEYAPVVFDLRLVPGREYHFVVFADFVPQSVTDATQTASIADQRTLGKHHEIGNTLADIKVVSDGINDECTDAYFATKDIVIENSAAQDIVLKRPYGKLRVIATDLAELNINVDPTCVVVTYDETHPTEFNAITGETKAVTSTATVTFDSEYNDGVGKGSLANHFYTADFDARKAPNAENVERHTHMTLFTDYILAEKEGQTPYHFTMKVYEDDSKADDKLIKETKFSTDIPVERNKLTTVIGNVLTTATEIEVRIDDNFAGETVKNVVFVDTVQSLQEALDNYVNGQTILFRNNIKGDVTVQQVDGKDYVIDGNNYNYDGVIFINGRGNQSGTDSVTIKNVNFTTARDSINFIDADKPHTGYNYNYAHNVTVESCSFNATGVDVVGLKLRAAKNIIVKDCVANGTTRSGASGMHSLAQLYDCNTVLFDNVNVDALEGGVAFGTSLNPTIKNSTLVGRQYGIRADASVATTLNIENVNVTAEVPVIMRYTSGDYIVNITGQNSFDAPGYQVVFTKNKDDKPFEAPESNWVLNGGDDLLVFPGDQLFAYNAASLQYLLDNAQGGDEILFAADIVGNVIVPEIANSTITINGRHYNFDGYFQINGKSQYKGATTVFENIEFETANSANLLDSAFIYCGEIDGTSKRYPDNVTIKGCTFTAKDAAVHNSVGAKFWSVNGNLVIEDCAANGLHSLVQLTSCSTANVTIDRVGIVNGKNGIAVGDAKLNYIKNTNIASNEYGIRANGTGEYTLNLENVNIKAAKPVIVRKASKKYTVNFTGDNTLETSGYQVIFTTGNDDVTFVAPADYSLTGADSFRVFPRDADQNDYIYTADDLQAAIDAGVKDIVLQPGVYEETINLKSDVTIEGLDGAVAHCFNLNGADNVTLKNIEFDAAKAKMAYDGNGNERFYASILSGGANKNNSGTNGLVIDGCTFTGHFADGGTTIAFNDRHRGSGQSGNITIKNCTFETTGGYVDIYTYYSGKGAFNIENNIFKSETTDRAIYLGKYQSSTPIVVKGNRFEKYADFASATLLQPHSAAYSPSFDESDNTFAN
ncbi:MAG: hypothetical protein IKJ38_04520 [Alistipes sp.]|nr:hypothetical protein [Alistipes sp.]